MRYNYYIDYTNTFKLAKKIYIFLEGIKQENSLAQFDFFQCCKYLRRSPYPRTKKKLNSPDTKQVFFYSIVRDDFAEEIDYILTILDRIGAIEKQEFKPLKEIANEGVSFSEKKPTEYRTYKIYNYEYQVIVKNVDSWDELVASSQYAPLEGFKQVITEEFLTRKTENYDIKSYQSILDDCKKQTYQETVLAFKNLAIWEWFDAYEIMKGGPIEEEGKIENNFEFIIDCGYVVKNDKGHMVAHQNERVVAIAGFSKMNDNHRERDASRLAGYRKRFFNDWADKEIDTGHYIAHTIWEYDEKGRGVDLEFNLFPQKRPLNQGHSEEGKLYRKMEKYCADNRGIFLFVRPIYGDSSDRPFVLEYGIIKPDLTLWVEQFTNI